MNNQQFVTIMQSCLFSFIDNFNVDEIIALNPQYNRKLVLQGIQLAGYLKAKEDTSNG